MANNGRLRTLILPCFNVNPLFFSAILPLVFRRDFLLGCFFSFLWHRALNVLWISIIKTSNFVTRCIPTVSVNRSLYRTQIFICQSTSLLNVLLFPCHFFWNNGHSKLKLLDSYINIHEIITGKTKPSITSMLKQQNQTQQPLSYNLIQSLQLRFQNSTGICTAIKV